MAKGGGGGARHTSSGFRLMEEVSVLFTDPGRKVEEPNIHSPSPFKTDYFTMENIPLNLHFINKIYHQK